VRGFLPGFGYQCGVAGASQIPHVQALFAAHTTYAQTMALSAALVFIVCAVVATLGPERRAWRLAAVDREVPLGYGVFGCQTPGVGVAHDA